MNKKSSKKKPAKLTALKVFKTIIIVLCSAILIAAIISRLIHWYGHLTK